MKGYAGDGAAHPHRRVQESSPRLPRKKPGNLGESVIVRRFGRPVLGGDDAELDEPSG